jgi:hypothetical protein
MRVGVPVANTGGEKAERQRPNREGRLQWREVRKVSHHNLQGERSEPVHVWPGRSLM